MADWRTQTVEECLTPLRLGSVTKLQTQDYRPSGRFPIIDQGQALIAGWTDDEGGLIQEDLPVVVFGDHTRTFKFVDFPFVRGADGTQILKPKPGVDPLFFYYALRGVDLPSRGYNRHFKALKEKSIPIPSASEQTDIARSLKLLDNARAVQGQEVLSWERCKRAVLRMLFTKGLRGEETKETEIGIMPASWSTPPLEDVAAIYSSSRMSYSELLRRDDGVKIADAYRVLGIKVMDMNRCEAEVVLDEAELSRRVELAEAQRRCIPPGAIVFPKNGAAVATNKKRRVEDWCALDPNVMALHSRNGTDQGFLFQWMQNFDLRSIVKPGPVPNFGKGDISGVRVPMPPTLNEQREIVAVLDAVDRKLDLLRRKHSLLDQLFKALLRKLITNEIQVANLDLSALKPAKLVEVAP